MRLFKKLSFAAILLVLIIAGLAAISETDGGFILPRDLTEIKDEAFLGMTSMEEIIIPDGTTSIGARAFAHSSLEQIQLPATLASIADDAFEGCENLTATVFEHSYAHKWCVENGVSVNVLPAPNPASDFIYRLYGDSCEITGYIGTDPDIIIPATIEGRHVSFGMACFMGCTNLTRAVISEGITSLGESTFSACTALSSVSLPSTLQSMGWEAFSGCTSLKSICIPASATNIFERTFRGCSNLEAINIATENKVYTSRDGVVFTKDMQTLLIYPEGKTDTNYVVPETVTSISNNTFGNFYSGNTFMTVISFPNNLTSIGHSAFQNCTRLTCVQMPDTLTSIDYDAFINCSSLTSITIPEGVTELVDTFENCTSLDEVTLPSTLKSIGYCTFDNCTSLTSITIPEGVTSIYCDGGNTGAFNNCSALTDVVLPASLTNISKVTFNGCPDVVATVIQNTYAHKWCVENSISVNVLECPHIPDENCICTLCGEEAHTPGEDCVCAYCGEEVHMLDENCVCAGCGETMHELVGLEYSSCQECVNCDYAFHHGFDSGSMKLRDIIACERYDYDQHYATGTPVWIGWCADCGQYSDELILDETRTMLEDHTYDENGICTGCGSRLHRFEGNSCECIYCGAIEHSMTEDEMLGDICERCGLTDEENHEHIFEPYIQESDWTYASYDDTWHISTCICTQISRCSICLTNNPAAEPVELGISEKYEKHGDEGGEGSCSWCGHPMIESLECTHENTESVIYSYIYGGQTTEITDTYRKGIGYRVQWNRCLLCGTNPVSTEILEENVEVTLEHEYSHNNRCSSCGYVPLCKHTSASEKLISLFPKSCYPIDAQSHLAKGQGEYIFICDECGVPANNDGEIERYTELTEPHNFIPGTSVCMDCGYCPHENTVTTTSSETGVYRDITKLSHLLTDVETTVISCSDCGREISRTETLSNETKYVHTNLETGCVCGYTCSHTNTREDTNIWNYSHDDLVQTTEYTHTFLADATSSVTCKDCGVNIGSYTRKENYTSTHYFNEEGLCETCGYVNTSPKCTHDYMDFNSIWPETMGFTDVTEDTHTRIVSEIAYMFCPDCDYYDEIVFSENVPVVENHSFYEGICACSMESETGGSIGHVHEYAENSCVCLTCGETEHDESYWMDIHAVCERCGEMWHMGNFEDYFESVDKYTVLDEEYHYVTGTAVACEYCDECGLVLEETRQEAYTRMEAHTFENGACTGCGLEGCHHKNVSDCVCSDCGEEMHSNEYSCQCILCGSEAHRYVEKQFGIMDAELYESYDNDRHWVEGNAYVYDYCSSCQTDIPYANEFIAEGVRMLEDHSYVYRDGERFCLDCGHVWEYETTICSHLNREHRLHERLDVITEITPTYEIGTGSIIEYEYCLDCGEWLNQRVVEENVTVQKKHVYDIGDSTRLRCFNCLYAFQCLHEDVDWKVSEYCEGLHVHYDSGNHMFKGMVNLVGSCRDCGIDVYDGDYDAQSFEVYREILLPHTFESGICTQCGYEDLLIAHPNAYEVTYSYEGGIGNLSGLYDLVCVDETYHTGVKETLKYSYCPDCNKFVGQRTVLEETTERHHFEWENGTLWCRMCDARFTVSENFPSWNECKHRGEAATIESYYLYGGEYTNITPETHTLTDAELYVGHTVNCLDCGDPLDGGDGPTGDIVTHTEPHAFWEEEDGTRVCDCGYRTAASDCSHENTVSYLSGSEQWGTVSADKDGHVICYEVYAHVECTDCGAFLSGEPTAYQVWEPHNYDMNGVCVRCEFSFAGECDHPEEHYVTASDEADYYTRSTTINSTRHITYRMIMTTVRCGDCGVLISASAQDDQTLEKHVVRNGFCTECQCYISCAHENLGETVLTERVNAYQSSPDNHRTVTTRTETVHCSDCNLDVILCETETFAMEEHSFSDGMCRCGLYEQPTE